MHEHICEGMGWLDLARSVASVCRPLSKLAFVGPLLLCVRVGSAQIQGAKPERGARLELERGTILEQVPCVQHPEQSYAVYLPSDYSAARTWPIVYSFDPLARGAVPVRLQKEAADKYGYILAASNNSRNGSWKVAAEAADAMIGDTHARLSIDDGAVYFAGFSGGARVAVQLAILCKCAAGVLLSGAGLPINGTLPHDRPFEVFSAVGELDFNILELLPLQPKLEQAGYPRWLYLFEGPHEWAPSEAMDQALAWFRVQAMKANRRPKDSAFLVAQFSSAMDHARTTEGSGDLLNGWREYLQIAATFDGLVDVAALRAQADSLGKQKRVLDAAKQEAEDFREQTLLQNRVMAGLSGSEDVASGPMSANVAQVGARELRSLAEKEPRVDRARVYKRALAGAYIGAMEYGMHCLESRDYAQAVRAFSCATEAVPASEWAWRQRAMAAGLSGNRKECLAALRRSRDLATDKAAFADWATTSAAFEPIRSTSEFRGLLEAN